MEASNDNSDDILDESLLEQKPEIEVKPLILTDQHLLEDFNSSSMSKDFNSLGSNESIEERQAEMKPEELERNPILQVNQDSSTISLGHTKLESDRLIEVSELNNSHQLPMKEF